MIDKAYFIFGGSYARFDAMGDVTDKGYPKPIGTNWKGFKAAGFSSGIDAAVDWGDRVYLFKGDQYVRYDISANAIDGGYPKSISDGWAGLVEAGFGRDLECAVRLDNGKAFFFKGDSYVRYDVAADRADPGYPMKIPEQWAGLAEAGFGDHLDAAVNWGDGKVYFFKGDFYVRYDIAGDATDAGFPRRIDDVWKGLGAARRGARIDAIWTRPSGADTAYLTDAFFAELRAVAGRLSCAAEDMLVVMESESGVRPNAQNPHGKATGLIQFMPATLKALKWNDGPDAFRALSPEGQLPFVEKYYKRFNAKLDSPGKLYQATFLPATLNAATTEDTILVDPAKNPEIWADNKVLDTNKDGVITVGDLTARLEAVKSGRRWTDLVERLHR